MSLQDFSNIALYLTVFCKIIFTTLDRLVGSNAYQQDYFLPMNLTSAMKHRSKLDALKFSFMQVQNGQEMKYH